MEFLKKMVDIKRVSFILILLPYLIFHSKNTMGSPFFSSLNVIITIGILILIEVAIKWIISITKNYSQIVSLSIVFASTSLIYGIIITIYLQGFFYEHFGVFLRGRITMFFFICLFISAVLLTRKQNISYRVFNVFLIIFSLVALFSISNKEDQVTDINSIKNNFQYIPNANNNLKPVILIIADEYSSPDALYHINKDSSIYNFSKKLVNGGWTVKNQFYSYERSTIQSLSSLFNFNLSLNRNYAKQNVSDIGVYKLLNAALADTLRTKKIKVINYGIFDFGEAKPLTPLYFYPKNFLENILMYTSYYVLKYNTGGLKLKGLGISYYPMEEHHKFIFKTLIGTTQKVRDVKTFIYVHLLMPHSPMVLTPEFPLRKLNNLANYEAYWKFTNHKLEALLKDLCKENKYKIILTGDHGLRNNKRINFHQTFSAFYGFKPSEINRIKSVQDIGSLINASF